MFLTRLKLLAHYKFHAPKKHGITFHVENTLCTFSDLDFSLVLSLTLSILGNFSLKGYAHLDQI